MAKPEWQTLSDEQRRSRYRDYGYVIQNIFETINHVQAQVI